MKKASVIPMFYYPLEVVFTDDNQNILDLFERSFAPKYTIKTFINPVEAALYIKKQSIEKKNTFTEISHFIDNEDTSHIGINIRNIINMVENPERFNKIGILVTDQDMPQMNGLDLCKDLSHIPLKKILLTGQHLDKPAIYALNNNIINCYVEKSSDNAIKDIDNYIHILTKRYFSELTKSILGDVSQSQLAILQNASFVEVFNKTINSYSIKEYYLLDTRGSFLLIDANKKRYVLNVHTNQSLDEFCDFFAGEEIISELIGNIRNKEKIPFFGIGIDPVSVPLQDWWKHFYNANNSEGVIWSLIEH